MPLQNTVLLAKLAIHVVSTTNSGVLASPRPTINLLTVTTFLHTLTQNAIDFKASWEEQLTRINTMTILEDALK